MENKTKALLIGASGLTGSHCLNLLLEDNYFQEVEIWCRKPTGVKHKKLTETIINFEKLSDININAQLVFCCLGTTIKKAGTKENFFKTDHDYVIDLAKNTRQKAAEKFIYISSIGANAKSSNFYLKTKGQVEKDLKTVFTEGLFILRPSMLMGKRKEFRFGESIGKAVMSVLKYFMLRELNKYRGINAKNVAEAMLILSKKEAKGISIMESDEIMKLVHQNKDKI